LGSPALSSSDTGDVFHSGRGVLPALARRRTYHVACQRRRRPAPEMRTPNARDAHRPGSARQARSAAPGVEGKGPAAGTNPDPMVVAGFLCGF